MISADSPAFAPSDGSAEVLRFGDAVVDPRLPVARMSLYGGESSAASDEALASVRAELAPDIAAKMAAYVPQLPAAQVESIRAFAENAVILTLPQTSYTVETLLRPTMHFTFWAVYVVGAPLDARVIFNRSLIANYVSETMSRLTKGTQRNYRAWLFRVAEAVNPAVNQPSPLPLNERSFETPYTADELDALDRWSEGQATAYRRRGTATLLALGVGAGLTSREIARLRREAVTVNDNKVVSLLVSAGERSREVVVTARYEKSLRKALKGMPEGAFVFLPKRTRTENDVVSAFIGRTSTSRGTPIVRVRRMRNTWLVQHMANRVDVLTLMEAAGLQSLESISRLAQFVPRPSEEARTAQLRGVR